MHKELPSLVNAFLQREQDLQAEHRIVSFEHAQHIRKQLSESHYFGLTDAKFDPINPAHVRHLEELASQTQHLAEGHQTIPLVVVGVWSDSLLPRHYQNELYRAWVVAGQKGVDMVFVLNDEKQADQFDADFRHCMPHSVDFGLITSGRVVQPTPIKRPHLRVIKG